VTRETSSEATATEDRRVPGATSSAVRPRRPILIELAAAILVVGGALSILTSIGVALHLADQGQPIDAVALLTVGIGAGLLILGVLIRYGRAWLVTVNVVAVVSFLELTSGSIVGLFFGALDVFVVLALIWERGWFQWAPPPSDTA
jgi:hypothetical protein